MLTENRKRKRWEVGAKIEPQHVLDNNDFRRNEFSVVTKNDILLQKRQLLSSLLIGLTLTVSPFHSDAFSLLAQADSVTPPRPVSTGGGYGTPVGSAPYFNSASAARLFVNPTSTNRGSPEARRQLARQRELQDSRLEQCFEAGIDWEQCFYYGTGSTEGSVAPMTLPDFGQFSSPLQKTEMQQQSNSKTKVPTW